MILTPGWSIVIAFIGSLATAAIALIALCQSGIRFNWEKEEQRKNNERESLIDVVAAAERWAAAVRRYAPLIGVQLTNGEPPLGVEVPAIKYVSHEEYNRVRGAVTDAGLTLQRAIIKAEVLTGDTDTLTTLEKMLSIAGTLSYFIGESLPHSDRNKVQMAVHGRTGEICQLADSVTDRLRSELGHTEPVERPFKAVEYDF